MREHRCSKTGIASLPHVNLAFVMATGERQEHLYARCRSEKKTSESLTSSQSSGPQEMSKKNVASCSIRNSFFLKKEKTPTTKIFDDDEWIRSLTEAEETTTDIPDERITHDQSEVDPEKGPTHPDGGVSAKMCLEAARGAQ